MDEISKMFIKNISPKISFSIFVKYLGFNIVFWVFHRVNKALWTMNYFTLNFVENFKPFFPRSGKFTL